MNTPNNTNNTPKTIPGYIKRGQKPTPTPTPQTYPTDQPISILTRDPLPEENPTPAQTILEGIIFLTPQERNRAERTVQQQLDLLNAEKLPLSFPLQAHLRALTNSDTLTTRTLNATLPREDGKPIPAALHRAALHANTTHLQTLATYQTLFDQHRQTHQQKLQQEQQDKLTEEEKHQKGVEDRINDLRIPIKGLAVHRYKLRIQALTKALNNMEDWNQTRQRSGLKQEFHIPFTPKTLFTPPPTPTPSSSSTQPLTILQDPQPQP